MTDQHSLSRQFATFVAIGAISALCTLLIRSLCNAILPFEAAIALAQMAGMLIAFSLNRHLVFSNHKHILLLQLSRFALVNLFSLGIVTIVSSFCFRIALPSFGINDHAALLAQLMGLGACTIPSFAGHKYFSFQAAAQR